MSSFPCHNDNILELQKMGFDVDQYIEDGEATLESWHYDELVDIMEMMIIEMLKQDFKVKPEGKTTRPLVVKEKDLDNLVEERYSSFREISPYGLPKGIVYIGDRDIYCYVCTGSEIDTCMDVFIKEYVKVIPDE